MRVMASTSVQPPDDVLKPAPPVSEPVSEAASEQVDAVGVEKFQPGWRFLAAFGSMCIIPLVAALDATSVSVALPIMARALGGSAIEAFWSGTSSLLTSTVFQPVIGSFSHIFGRKALIYISLGFSLVGSIIPAVANNFTLILVGRCIQGIGGGGVICLTEMVVVDTVPLRERGKWLSFFGAMWSIGTVAGPLLAGGGFSQNVSWRWIFWINLAFIGIGAAMTTIFLKLNQKHGAFLTKLCEVDWIGMVLFLASTTGFLIPVTWSGVQHPWDSWRTLVPLIVCGAGMVGFVLYIEFVAANPLIRTSVFKNRSAAILCTATVIHDIILWAILYYLPLYLEAVKGSGPILTGVALFPWTFTVAPASIATGVAIAILCTYRWANPAGWFLATLGMGVLIVIKVDASTPAWIFISLVGGIGTGSLFPAMALAVQASATAADQAHAANMFSFFRAFGQTLGVAIGGAMFQNQMRKKMLMFPMLAEFADGYSQDAAGLVRVIEEMPGGEVKDQLKESYTDALKYIWIVVLVLSAVATIGSWFIEAYDMDGAMDQERAFVDKDKVKDTEKSGDP